MSPRRSRVVLREAGAMLTQARYAVKDLRESHEPGTGPCVILIHGLYATAGVFRPLRRRLQLSFDASTHTLSYTPGISVLSLERRLSQLVARTQGTAPLILIGHSFGGLVVRSYASNPGVSPRLVQTISLAAPFGGSLKSSWVPPPGKRDVEPGAPLLQRLRCASRDNERIPHLTICAADDQLIVPDAFPAFGEHLLIDGTGHNGILFNECAHDAICAKISKLV